MDKIKVVAVVGPTASGKTAMAIDIAQNFNGEIISADSMQIYKGMDIGTAKPSKEEMKMVPHHLIGYVDCNIKYSVVEYVKAAHQAILEVNENKKLPIIAGGTGLYVNSLLEDITFDTTKSNESIRKELEDFALKNGAVALHKRLEEIDCVAANEIHCNNIPRVIRAIEIYMLTGKTITQSKIDSRANETRYNSYKIGLTYQNRELLYQKINSRVDIMLENGILEEAKLMYNSFDSSTALQAIGYKEFFPYFDGKISLEKAIENLKQYTRNYAKRQLTWFKKDKNVNWFYIDNYQNIDLLKKDINTNIKFFLQN
ncbi:MAG: tRNA (adenosine(37)-N6)-dimethylallyltransferase MiaA [Oscillospiraceae bacterium]